MFVSEFGTKNAEFFFTKIPPIFSGLHKNVQNESPFQGEVGKRRVGR